MERLYHLVRQPVELRAGGEIHPESLAAEGFVHLCLEGQVAWVANRHLSDAGVLWLMELEAELLPGELRFEESGSDGRFPHLYGPIPHAAIARQMPLIRDAANNWALSPQMGMPLEKPFNPLG